MAPIVTAALQIVSFLVSHKEQIKQLVLDIEGIIKDAPGTTKAAAVRAFIAGALGVEDKIEQAWPFVAPIFNIFVARTKKADATPAAGSAS